MFEFERHIFEFQCHISWIPGTHILLIINDFAETLCDIDN